MCSIKSDSDQVENVAISWLTKLQSSDLSPEQEEAFFRWLKASPLHQKAYIYAEQLWVRGLILK